MSNQTEKYKDTISGLKDAIRQLKKELTAYKSMYKISLDEIKTYRNSNIKLLDEMSRLRKKYEILYKRNTVGKQDLI